MAAVGANFTDTSQLPGGIFLALGPRSSSSQTWVKLKGLVKGDSISIRIGSGTLFFFTLPALVILTVLVSLEPTSTSPKFRTFGLTLSLPTTGVGVAVGVAVAVAVAVGVGVGVAASGATTENGFDSLDALYCAVPGKLAASVMSPLPDGVI